MSAEHEEQRRVRPNNVGELLEWLAENEIGKWCPLYNYDCAPSADLEFRLVEGSGIVVTVLDESEYEYDDECDDEDDDEEKDEED